jgi:hypothetical protein
MILLIKLSCLIGLLYGSYLVLRLIINIKEWDHDHDHDVNENITPISAVPRCGFRSYGVMHDRTSDSSDKSDR